MRNGTKQNGATFVAFYVMCAVTFVLLDVMADVSIAGQQWSHRPSDSHSKPYLHRKKNRICKKNHPTCCNPTNYEESIRSSLILVASYDMPQRKAEVLFYTVKTPRDPTGRDQGCSQETMLNANPNLLYDMYRIVTDF